MVTDHLSRLNHEGLKEFDDGVLINETLHGEHPLSVASKELQWFVVIANYLVSGILPYGIDYRQQKNSYMIANSTIGRSHYFTRDVQMV